MRPNRICKTVTHGSTTDLGTLQTFPGSLSSPQIVLNGRISAGIRRVIRVTCIGNKYHPACGNKIEKGLDFAMFFKRTTDIIAISFVLRKMRLSVRAYTDSASSESSVALSGTCLNVPNKKGATRSLALYAFFNNRIMNFVITFAADIPSSSAKTSIVIIGVGNF